MTSKPTISKHKSGSSQMQSFDIIPPEKVMPSASSRPVITSNKPQQLDNTLMQPPTAPPLVRKRKIVAPPPVTAGDGTELEVPGLPFEEVQENGQSTAPTLPPAPGIEEILAKKASRQAVAPAPATELSPAPAPSPARIEELELTPDTPAPQIDDRIEEPVEPAAPEEKPADDIPEGMPDLSVDTDAEPAQAKAAPALAEEQSKAEQASSNNAESPKEVAPAETPKPVADKPHEDSVEAALANGGDKDAAPQAHSPALKKALTDLDVDAPADGEAQHHHELYGGKPVIAIHKHHGGSSVLATLLWLLVCLVVAVAAVDLLADAGIIEIPYDVPITDFIKE